MPMLVNIDGRLLPPEQATISVLDRGFLYGDSVYEVIRTYGGKPFALDPHFDRLERSAASLQIPLLPRETLHAAVLRTLEASGNPESYCRIIVTRGSGPLTLDPTSAVEPRTLILVKELDPFPEWMFQQGIRVYIPSVRRNLRTALDPAIKSGNYLNSVLALGEAKRQGYDDALMLDAVGRLTEATSSNLFLFRRHTLYTPALDVGILEGITRGILLALAREAKIPAVEGELSTSDLTSADEVFLTSTLREVMPVVQVNDHRVGAGKPGPQTARVRDLFRAYVQQTK
jgi:branched-chain amino acid aminotransferase